MILFKKQVFTPGHLGADKNEGCVQKNLIFWRVIFPPAQPKGLCDIELVHNSLITLEGTILITAIEFR